MASLPKRLTPACLLQTAEGLHGIENEICDSDEYVYHHLLSIADAMIARFPTSAEEDKLIWENASGLPLRWVWQPAQLWRSFWQQPQRQQAWVLLYILARHDGPEASLHGSLEGAAGPFESMQHAHQICSLLQVKRCYLGWINPSGTLPAAMLLLLMSNSPSLHPTAGAASGLVRSSQKACQNQRLHVIEKQVHIQCTWSENYPYLEAAAPQHVLQADHGADDCARPLLQASHCASKESSMHVADWPWHTKCAWGRGSSSRVCAEPRSC